MALPHFASFIENGNPKFGRVQTDSAKRHAAVMSLSTELYFRSKVSADRVNAWSGSLATRVNTLWCSNCRRSISRYFVVDCLLPKWSCLAVGRVVSAFFSEKSVDSSKSMYIPLWSEWGPVVKFRTPPRLTAVAHFGVPNI